LEAKWDQFVHDFQVPSGLLVQLGEISGGSNTPKMVSKLLEWRKENFEECESYWKDLDNLQSRLLEQFSKIAEMEQCNRKQYEEELRASAQDIIGRPKTHSPLSSLLMTMQKTYNV
jgi:phosphomevalonate kinase